MHVSSWFRYYTVFQTTSDFLLLHRICTVMSERTVLDVHINLCVLSRTRVIRLRRWPPLILSRKIV